MNPPGERDVAAGRSPSSRNTFVDTLPLRDRSSPAPALGKREAKALDRRNRPGVVAVTVSVPHERNVLGIAEEEIGIAEEERGRRPVRAAERPHALGGVGESDWMTGRMREGERPCLAGDRDRVPGVAELTATLVKVMSASTHCLVNSTWSARPPVTDQPAAWTGLCQRDTWACSLEHRHPWRTSTSNRLTFVRIDTDSRTAGPSTHAVRRRFVVVTIGRSSCRDRGQPLP